VSLVQIILILIFAWVVIYLISVSYGKKYFSPYGPALLIKTRAGINTIEKVSKSRFWDYFVSFFYYAMPIMGIATVVLLIWEAILVFSIPKSAAPPLSYALALPGINPAIPVGFGIIGLIVAVALHEGSHGIAARRFNIPVRSTGVLWFIIPVGAFVEPDEEVMKEKDPKIRGKVFAAGPGMNVSLAVVFFLLSILLAYSISPIPGAPVQSSVNASLLPGDIVQAIDNITVSNVGTISNLSLAPGSDVSLSILRDGHHIREDTVYGVYITGTIKGYPAYEAGMKPGDVIISLGNYPVRNITTFENALQTFKANQSTTVSVLYDGTPELYNITFASRYSYLVSLGETNPGPRDYPFMGVDVSILGAVFFDQYSYISLLKNPASAGPLGFFVYLGLPFHSELPLPSSLLSSFTANPVILNMEYLFYWLFWLNFALGLTNILPIVPLDGGYVLLNTPILQKNKRMRDALVAAVSLSVLFLILWQFIIPRI
jgi:membrane-associated protease RseP (regulator of RpoE activity)